MTPVEVYHHENRCLMKESVTKYISNTYILKFYVAKINFLRNLALIRIGWSCYLNYDAVIEPKKFNNINCLYPLLSRSMTSYPFYGIFNGIYLINPLNTKYLQIYHILLPKMINPKPLRKSTYIPDS